MNLLCIGDKQNLKEEKQKYHKTDREREKRNKNKNNTPQYNCAFWSGLFLYHTTPLGRRQHGNKLDFLGRFLWLLNRDISEWLICMKYCLFATARCTELHSRGAILPCVFFFIRYRFIRLHSINIIWFLLFDLAGRQLVWCLRVPS